MARYIPITKEMIDENINILLDSKYKIFSQEIANYYIEKTERAFPFLPDEFKTLNHIISIYEKKGYYPLSNASLKLKIENFDLFIDLRKKEEKEKSKKTEGFLENPKDHSKNMTYTKRDIREVYNQLGREAIIKYLNNFPCYRNFSYVLDTIPEMKKEIEPMFYKWQEQEMIDNFKFLSNIKDQFN